MPEQDKPQPPPTVSRINERGDVEIIDLFTGKVVAVQEHGGNDDYLKNRFDNLTKIMTHDGREVYIERHMDPARVMRNGQPQPQYSLTWAELLYDLLINGHTLTSATARLNLPLATVNRWRSHNADFAAIINAAKLTRAESFQDEAITHARKHGEPEPHLLVSTLMSAAKASDPDQYNPKQKVEHDISVAHTFVVISGVDKVQSIIPPGFENAILDATPKRLVVAPVAQSDDDFFNEEKTTSSTQADKQTLPRDQDYGRGRELFSEATNVSPEDAATIRPLPDIDLDKSDY